MSAVKVVLIKVAWSLVTIWAECGIWLGEPRGWVYSRGVAGRDMLPGAAQSMLRHCECFDIFVKGLGNRTFGQHA